MIIAGWEIPLVTVTLYAGFDAQELGGFGFELCSCSPGEVQAVFRCYLKHARHLKSYFHICHQMFEPVSAGAEIITALTKNNEQVKYLRQK